MPVPESILVVRNDKLGDFMLALPVFHLLKRALPDTAIHALVPSYTQPLADACEAIDSVQTDPGPAAPGRQQMQLLRTLRTRHYDAMLTLFSTSRIGLLGLLAGIPYRLAPATKFAQVYYNHRLVQRRSRSAQPEYAYNLDLAERCLRDLGVPPAPRPAPPYLHFADETVDALRRSFCETHGIPGAHRLVFVHPGSGGSASNLEPGQYAQLAAALRSDGGHTVVISAGPGEIDYAAEVAARLEHTPHVVYHSTGGLTRFAQHIQFADVFVSGSTGPLHVAGALDRPTAGFYPRRRSATALRWQTLNSEPRRLAFSPAADTGEEDMHGVDLDAAAQRISERFLSGTTDA